MTAYMEKLEERIRRLKTDIRAGHDWRLLKIEIEKRGGKWRAENGTLFELRDGAIYQYEHEGGVDQLVITDLAAEEPYVAELSLDGQHATPATWEELRKSCAKAAHRAPTTKVERIVVVEKDWLTKIASTRWHTMNWKRHLAPTEMTLRSPKRAGKPFNADLIYAGDTFDVIP